MKRKIGILALVLVIGMCFFTVSAFAGEDSGNSRIPFVDSDEISPEYPDIQTDEDLFEQFEELFGEDSGAFMIAIIIGTAFSSLFFPAVIVIIVFAILHSNAKKKLKEYERFFGPVTKNQPTYYNPNAYAAHYATPPVNPTGMPMGTASVVNPYTSQNDVNNQQGGSI